MSFVASFTCAEGVSHDTLTGRITLFNVVDSFVVRALPSMLIRANAVAMYDLDSAPRSFVECVQLLGPDDQIIAEQIGPVELKGREPGTMPSAHRSIRVFWKTVLSQAGDHHLVLSHADIEGSKFVELARIRIPVVIARNEVLNLQAPPIASGSDGTTQAPNDPPTPPQAP